MDIRLPLACVLIVGCAVGFSLPAADVEQELLSAETDASNPQLASAIQQSQSSAGWSDEIVLEREYDGHFYADVHVDGVPTRMLIDTGASVIALTGDDAAAMGLYWDDSEVVPVAQGASGEVRGVHTSLPQVTLGDFSAQNVRAIIVPEGLSISLLGQSFLGQIDTVQIADNRMVLGG